MVFELNRKKIATESQNSGKILWFFMNKSADPMLVFCGFCVRVSRKI